MLVAAREVVLLGDLCVALVGFPRFWDEVVTGFRVGLGGMAPILGHSPDLTLLGKIIGGGMPIGAFAGRADIMEAVLGSDADPSSSSLRRAQRHDAVSGLAHSFSMINASSTHCAATPHIKLVSH